MAKVLIIVSHVGDSSSLARTLVSIGGIEQGDIVIAPDIARALLNFRGRKFALAVLGYNTNTQPDLICLQVRCLRKDFGVDKVVVRGPYDLGYKSMGADDFASIQDDHGFAAKVKQMLATVPPAQSATG
jgi:hypothetical protein